MYWSHFSAHIFKLVLYPDANFTVICFKRFNLLASIGSDNALAPNRRQAIISTSDGMLYWRIYASLGLSELTASFCFVLFPICINTYIWVKWPVNKPQWNATKRVHHYWEHYDDVPCALWHQILSAMLNNLFTLTSKTHSRHWGRDKMPFLGNIVKCIFLNENIWITSKISM